MPIVYEIKVPGRPFKESMDAMRHRMIERTSVHDPIPIQIFFDYFRLTASNQSLGDKLRARGTFVPTARAYRNQGNLVDEIIRDIGPERRQMTLYIGPILNVETTLSPIASPDTLTFEFTQADENDGNNIVLGVDELPPELGFGNTFVLRRIIWDPTGTRYIAIEDGVSDHQLEIFVDAALEDMIFLSGIRGFTGAIINPVRMVPMALAGQCGGCCGGFCAKPKPAPQGELCVNVHAKILVPPYHSIQEQVTATNGVYRAGKLTIHLASVETLHLPQFEDLDVGTCVSNTVTAEQDALFRQFRANAGPTDVCAYWVRTMTSNTGNTIGCAAHPPGVPAVALMGASSMTPWVLAHEIGHVLGLSHVDPSDGNNLMRPIDSFSNPPPVLNGGQIDTMRWSELLFSC
ncbi:reprolysin-like metallopeptidase [Bradyrhizobium sp. SZCCHNS3002]|uniref:reprolysin-like metallopeptidase n=1 Tax=Bradyrhizobium sp. SZCCHNS3002 TaxID=3057310 RepID=UPI0028ED7549|nr:hypothetical protein [Bradyrhizobium sp. SZCCHNS3002]